MRTALGNRLVLILALVVLIFAAGGQTPVQAESNGSGGTPFPAGGPTLDEDSASTAQSSDLSVAELLYIYLLVL